MGNGLPIPPIDLHDKVRARRLPPCRFVRLLHRGATGGRRRHIRIQAQPAERLSKARICSVPRSHLLVS